MLQYRLALTKHFEESFVDDLFVVDGVFVVADGVSLMIFPS